MEAIARAPRADVLAAATIVGALAVLAGSASSGLVHAAVAPLVLAVILFATWHGTLLRWDSLVGLILVIVLFVPITQVSVAGKPPVSDRALPTRGGAGRLHLDHVALDRPASTSRAHGVRQATPPDRALGPRVRGRQSRSSRVAQHVRCEVADVLSQLRPGLLRHRKRDPETKRGDPSAQGPCPRVRGDRTLVPDRAPERFQHFLPRPLGRPLPPIPGRRCHRALRPATGARLCAAPDRARRRAGRSNPARGVFRANCRPPLVDRGCRFCSLAHSLPGQGRQL